MTTQFATINIKHLRLRTYIGFNTDEMEKQQDVVINIQIRYEITDEVLQDKVEGALNYKTVTKKVITHVEQGRFLLLEKLVADILEILEEEYPGQKDLDQWLFLFIQQMGQLHYLTY